MSNADAIARARMAANMAAAFVGADATRIELANALVGAALHVIEDSDGPQAIAIYANMALAAAQTVDPLEPGFHPAGGATGIMRQFAQVGERMEGMGVASESVAAAMLAAAMNLWGNLHGFHDVARWLRENADVSSASYDPPATGSLN